MNESSEVLIMMATYNGERYIAEQIDSILSQTHQNWKMIIRDDGSSDQTMKVINKYRHDPRIKILQNNSQNCGWQLNFQRLLKKAPACGYYMFCDQDDIWDYDKIEKFLKEIKRIEKNNLPALTYGNMRIIDVSGRVVCEDFNETYDMRVSTRFDCFFSQRAYGCSMMFNRSCYEKILAFLSDGEYSAVSHDALAMRVCTICDGTISFINSPTMGYRRFENNATSGETFEISKGRVLQCIRSWDSLAYSHVSTYQQSLIVIKLAEKVELPLKKRKELIQIARVIRRGGIQGGVFWIKKHVSCGNKIRTLSHFFVLVSGTYKKYMS